MTSDEKRVLREDDERRHEGDGEEVRVTDRRRFHPDGSRRESDEEAEAAGAAFAEEENTGAEAPAEPVEVVPASIAREWERRALDAESKIRDITDAYRHHKAELDATRARLERDQEARVAEALGRSLSRILEAVDGLELALSHAEDGPLAQGVRLVQRKMLETLAAEGVVRIETIGLPFDPNVMEAIAMIPVTDPQQANTVVGESRAGYRFRDKVLRPPQVHVGMNTASE